MEGWAQHDQVGKGREVVGPRGGPRVRRAVGEQLPEPAHRRLLRRHGLRERPHRRHAPAPRGRARALAHLPPPGGARHAAVQPPRGPPLGLQLARAAARRGRDARRLPALRPRDVHRLGGRPLRSEREGGRAVDHRRGLPRDAQEDHRHQGRQRHHHAELEQPVRLEERSGIFAARVQIHGPRELPAEVLLARPVPVQRGGSHSRHRLGDADGGRPLRFAALRGQRARGGGQWERPGGAAVRGQGLRVAGDQAREDRVLRRLRGGGAWAPRLRLLRRGAEGRRPAPQGVQRRQLPAARARGSQGRGRGRG
mmetsp:Transcript_124072/g.333176  ORF Transcript_124072/g.333176 Transcript_124072/m.333176 type:complete len:310 (-) Transcript_124072:627-1556(-)